MLYTRKSRGSLILGVAFIAVLALSIAGCGGGEDTGRDDVALRSRRDVSSRPEIESRPSPTEIETTPKPVEPEEAVVTIPEPQKEVTYEEAEAAYHERRYGEAVELFTLYTDRKSENPWGHYMLGLSAWKAGEHERAEGAFERALELDGNHVKSLLNLGRVLLDMGRPDEALARIGEALTIDPESNIAYRLQGRALDQLGREEEAIGTYRRAIRLDDRDAWSMNNLGLLFLEEGRYDEALPPLARAVELKGDVAIFLNNLGMVLENTGHFRAAEEAYRSAVDIGGSFEKAHANLERLEAVVEDPGLPPVDLAVIAQGFIDEIESWSDGAGDSGQLESVEAEIDTIIVSDAGLSAADSTDNSDER